MKLTFPSSTSTIEWHLNEYGCTYTTRVPQLIYGRSLNPLRSHERVNKAPIVSLGNVTFSWKNWFHRQTRIIITETSEVRNWHHITLNSLFCEMVIRGQFWNSRKWCHYTWKENGYSWGWNINRGAWRNTILVPRISSRITRFVVEGADLFRSSVWRNINVTSNCLLSLFELVTICNFINKIVHASIVGVKNGCVA